MICCGPPVIFSFKPKVLCANCDDTLGTQLYASPCDCFHLKMCLCCGNPCYVQWKVPFMPGPSGSSAPIKNGEAFCATLKDAVEAYQQKHSIPSNEACIFENVEDNVVDFGGSKKAGVTKQEMQGRGDKRTVV